MTKLETYRKLQDAGHSFLANVILVQHANPARKLRGALLLIERGTNVAIGVTIDTLLIDGSQASWSSLEEVR